MNFRNCTQAMARFRQRMRQNWLILSPISPCFPVSKRLRRSCERDVDPHHRLTIAGGRVRPLRPSYRCCPRSCNTQMRWHASSPTSRLGRLLWCPLVTKERRQPLCGPILQSLCKRDTLCGSAPDPFFSSTIAGSQCRSSQQKRKRSRRNCACTLPTAADWGAWRCCSNRIGRVSSVVAQSTVVRPPQRRISRRCANQARCKFSAIE